MTLNRLGLVVHGGRAEAVAAAGVVRAWCADNAVRCTGIDVWHDGGRRDAREEVRAAGDPDLVVTLGGDGTFLRGARLAAENDALVLGVDLGRVGFLTEVSAAGVGSALDSVRADRFDVDERMLLTLRASCRLEVPAAMEALIEYGRGPLLPPPQVRPDCEINGEWGIPLDVTALNDVVLEKLARDRQVSVGGYVSGRLLASYSADALLVATPTGSTAYSFAAGGPVVSPRARALVFTPVAPHMAFDRSVVTAPDEPVGLRVLERSGRAAVTVDGQLRGVLGPGDWIGVYAAPRPLRAVRLEPMDFYGRLRERMNDGHGLPVLPPLPAHDGHGEPRRGATPGQGRGQGGGRGGRPAGAGGGGPGPQGRRLPEHLVRRSPAARGDRAGPGHEARRHALRRADLGPGPELVGEVLSVMKRLATSGMTMIVVTHEIGFARGVADEVVFMSEGRLVEKGPPSQVIDAPVHESTRAFVDSIL